MKYNYVNGKIAWIFILFLASSTVHAMVYDNRFLPLLAPIQSLFPRGCSFVFAQAMVTTAHDSINQQQEKIGLPEIWGTFDQAQLARGFVCAGCLNPLRPDWQNAAEIGWKMNGKRQMQGAAFYWYQQLTQYLSMGTSWLFMRVNSRQEFKIQKVNFCSGLGDIVALDDSRRCMLAQLGLDDGITHQSGFGDIDWFIRCGNYWEYELKMRSIHAGIRGGLLIPTGVLREENKPSSIPFGGNGHWGVYAAIDALLEVKEDMYAGVYARINQRFPRTFLARMPIKQEPQPFGVMLADARVAPGPTFIFSPVIILEGLRPGLGIALNYSLVAHREDSWSTKSPANIPRIEKFSEWTSEFATINVYYDFGVNKQDATFSPVIQFRWDIPTDMLAAHGVNRTHRVMFGIQLMW